MRPETVEGSNFRMGVIDFTAGSLGTLYKKKLLSYFVDSSGFRYQSADSIYI